MTIQYIEPLNRAWGRMKTALFKPFDIHKWFVVGFNAFLAGIAWLVQCGFHLNRISDSNVSTMSFYGSFIPIC